MEKETKNIYINALFQIKINSFVTVSSISVFRLRRILVPYTIHNGVERYTKSIIPSSDLRWKDALAFFFLTGFQNKT